MILGLSAIGVSTAIAVFVIAVASASVAFFGIPLPLVTADRWWLSLIGYLLTPIVVIACYGWDAIGQRNALRANRNFVPKQGFTRALLWAAGASVLVGAWHVLNLSVPLSEAWGIS